MKLSKILLGSVVAAAMAFGMLGCAMNEDEHEIITVKGDTASINYTNTSNEVYRGFRTLRTKHTDAVAVVTIDTNKTIDSTDTVNFDGKSGVFGFVIDLDTNKLAGPEGKKQKVYDFTSVTVRYNNESNKLETYISRFEGVDPTKMDGGNNFKDINNTELDKGATEGCEKTYLKGSTGPYATLTGVTPDANGLIKVAIEVIANTDGTYSVTYYDADKAVIDSVDDAKDESVLVGQRVKTGQIKSGKAPLTIKNNGGTGSVNNGTVTIDASWKNDANKIKQTEMGFYAGVYPKATLTGSIRLPYILHEDEVIEWDD